MHRTEPRAEGDRYSYGSSAERVRMFLDAASRHAGAAAIAFTARRDVAALAEASASDATERATGTALPLAGTLLCVKACIDVAGWITTAGSRVLDRRPTADAHLVARLRALGAVLIGQTNMTEFAYSGLGLNPHFGTPMTPLDASGERIAGGSTSGGAVAVALGLADLALGADTSGSVRIPAAFCAVAGFKPSRSRYSDEGIVPLCASFDVPGIIAPTAAACRRVDAILEGRWNDGAAHAPPGQWRIVVPRDFIGDATQPAVARAFESALDALSRQGVQIIERPLPYLAEIGEAAREGGIVSAEAYAVHGDLLRERLHSFDPRVGPRIAQGADVRAHDYLRAKRRLRDLAGRYDADLADCDALLTPTVAILPPRIADLALDEDYFAVNKQVLRFTELANRIDAPSVTIPAGAAGSDPIGVLLTGRRGDDARLLDMAAGVERVLRGAN